MNNNPNLIKIICIYEDEHNEHDEDNENNKITTTNYFKKNYKQTAINDFVNLMKNDGLNVEFSHASISTSGSLIYYFKKID
jgi:hypothetical protein